MRRACFKAADNWPRPVDVRALEAVMQDNRPIELEWPVLIDGEGEKRPRAALIVVGHRFETRRH
jgi:hypothetical protein